MSHNTHPYASTDDSPRELAALKPSFFEFKFQEYVFARIATTERLATATLNEVQRQGASLDERFARAEGRVQEAVADKFAVFRETSTEYSRLIANTEKETELLTRKVENLSRRMDDFYEILNKLAKFQHQLDGVETQVFEIRQAVELSRQVCEDRLASSEESSRRCLTAIEMLETRLAPLEARLVPLEAHGATLEARFVPLEERLAPLEARVAILTSTTLFLRALGRRLKKRAGQLRNRVVNR